MPADNKNDWCPLTGEILPEWDPSTKKIISRMRSILSKEDGKRLPKSRFIERANEVRKYYSHAGAWIEYWIEHHDHAQSWIARSERNDSKSLENLMKASFVDGKEDTTDTAKKNLLAAATMAIYCARRAAIDKSIFWEIRARELIREVESGQFAKSLQGGVATSKREDNNQLRNDRIEKEAYRLLQIDGVTKRDIASLLSRKLPNPKNAEPINLSSDQLRNILKKRGFYD